MHLEAHPDRPSEGGVASFEAAIFGIFVWHFLTYYLVHFLLEAHHFLALARLYLCVTMLSGLMGVFMDRIPAHVL